MTEHISDEVPTLLTGEAQRAVVLDAATHLRECDDCRQELVSAVVAHASLSSAQRFAPEVVAAGAQIGSALPEPDELPLPDLGEVFAQVRSEARTDEPGSRDADRPGRSRRTLIAAAAAVVVVGGGGAAGIALVDGSGPGGRTVALAAFDQGHTPAKVTLVHGDSMRIDASALPQLDSQQRYEVWLTDAGRTRMQPVGWVGTNGKALLPVPKSLMNTYSAIEISVQPIDASTYTYSGVSVLRGTYRA